VLDVDHHKVGAGAGRDPSEIIAAERAGAVDWSHASVCGMSESGQTEKERRRCTAGVPPIADLQLGVRSRRIGLAGHGKGELKASNVLSRGTLCRH
jgi:hypothetical protein